MTQALQLRGKPASIDFPAEDQPVEVQLTPTVPGFSGAPVLGQEQLLERLHDQDHRTVDNRRAFRAKLSQVTQEATAEANDLASQRLVLHNKTQLPAQSLLNTLAALQKQDAVEKKSVRPKTQAQSRGFSQIPHPGAWRTPAVEGATPEKRPAQKPATPVLSSAVAIS